jgi:transposase
MEHYAGIDVSLEFSSVCVVDAQGKIVREVKVAIEPEALVAFFASLGFAVKRVGLEAGPLSQWLRLGSSIAVLYVIATSGPTLGRIAKSKAAGALFGLTPKKYQSGEKDLTGGITRAWR